MTPQAFLGVYIEYQRTSITTTTNTPKMQSPMFNCATACSHSFINDQRDEFSNFICGTLEGW